MEGAIRPSAHDVYALQERVHASERQGWRAGPETFVSRRMLRQKPDKTVVLPIMLPDMMHLMGS
jgi:hypothetical protein